MASGTPTLDAAAETMRLVDYRGEVKQVPTRNGFGEGLIEAGTRNRDVLGICADLSESTRFEGFRKAHPAQYIEIGVSEQLLVAMAGGSRRSEKFRGSRVTRCSIRVARGNKCARSWRSTRPT